MQREGRRPPASACSETKRQKLDHHADPLERNDYRGFSTQDATKPQSIPRVGRDSVSADVFFAKYVSKRTPAVIPSLPLLSSGKLLEIKQSNLLDVAGKLVGDCCARFYVN